MKRSVDLILTAVIVALAVSACGEGGKTAMETARDFVPGRIGATGWVRVPEMEHFVGDSLFEYIDGAAEMYHKYDFVDVTVATYIKDDQTIIADLYLFKGPDRAFGMYTTLRPDEPDTIALGTEAFTFGPNVVFVKGSYLANVYTYDDFEEAVAAVKTVARALEPLLPGTARKPDMFRLFPERGRVAFTEKIFAEGFLAHGFLTDVYALEYSVDNVRARLFIAPDPAAEKFARWLEVAEPGSDPVPGWMGEVFEPGRALHLAHDYYGEIVAGWRGGKLVGVVGFDPVYREDFLAWAGSFE